MSQLSALILDVGVPSRTPHHVEHMLVPDWSMTTFVAAAGRSIGRRGGGASRDPASGLVDHYNWPHSAFGGRTPDEVFFGRPTQRRPLGRVDCFDGLLH